MRPARIRLKTLKEAAEYKPAGWLADVLDGAEIGPKWVVLSIHRYSALRLRYRDSRPSIFQEIRIFLRELVAWKKAGFRIADWKTCSERSKACRACPFSFGKIIPRCGRCGCTRAKLWLASAYCPEHKWGKIKQNGHETRTGRSDAGSVHPGKIGNMEPRA